MKKFLIASLILFSVESKSVNIDSLVYCKVDTIISVIHPNSTDSVNVVEIVNGVISVSTIFIKQPVIISVIKNPLFSGGIVGIILGIWRRIEKRRLRKRGLLKDK